MSDLSSMAAAIEQSRILGYEPIAIAELHRREGEVPHGVILIRRPERPIVALPFAVQNWHDRREELGSAAVLFGSGSYDLDVGQAMDEFEERFNTGELRDVMDGAAT